MTVRTETIGTADRIAAAMPWLDGAASVMERAFEPLLGLDRPRGPRDFLYGTWLGHPLHPAVVIVPLGAWSAAIVFDLLGEERAADLMVGIGIVGAAGAAVTGAAQWQDTVKLEDPRRLGTLHALLNYTATGLMVASWLMRRQRQRKPGIALATLGLGINLTSAWIGGDLAYDLGIGVNRTAFQSPPMDWTDVGTLDELPDGKPMRVDAKGTPVLLLRQGNRIRAIDATCSHLGGPLDKGTIEGETVTCPWHASVFSLQDGAALHGPATMPVAAYEVRVQDGRIAIRANAEQAGGVVPAGSSPAAEGTSGETVSP